MLRRIIQRWLGIHDLQDMIDAIAEQSGIELKEQPKYKAKKKQKPVGFNTDQE